MARGTHNGPSLAAGAITCIFGIVVLGVAPLLLVPGIRLIQGDASGLVGEGLLAAGVAVVSLGAVLLGLGARAIQRFERRLLIAVNRRPWATD